MSWQQKATESTPEPLFGVEPEAEKPMTFAEKSTDVLSAYVIAMVSTAIVVDLSVWIVHAIVT